MAILGMEIITAMDMIMHLTISSGAKYVTI